jgi:hydroxymethylpyrimidine pyrophosphatase-like HAD family hydrolase
MLQEDARLLGASSYIGEAGCVIARDSGRTIMRNCGPFGNVEGLSVFDEIAATGAPDLLLAKYNGMLTYHLPWSQSHTYSHLMRGHINTTEANTLLEKSGHGELKVVDNGVIEDRGYGMNTSELHAYHIIPREAGKGSAIRLHLQAAGLTREDAFACGDSAQDLEMAEEVGTLYLMSNAISNGLGESEITGDHGNIVIVGAPMVEGFLLAVRKALGV